MRKIVLLLFPLIFLIACATWKESTVIGYEATGITLKEIQSTAKDMCNAGALKPEDCEKIKSLYNKTRTVYITAGDALIVAINTEDAFVKQKALEAYQKSINEISILIPQIIKLAGELGIKVGGQ